MTTAKLEPVELAALCEELEVSPAEVRELLQDDEAIQEFCETLRRLRVRCERIERFRSRIGNLLTRQSSPPQCGEQPLQRQPGPIHFDPVCNVFRITKREPIDVPCFGQLHHDARRDVFTSDKPVTRDDFDKIAESLRSYRAPSLFLTGAAHMSESELSVWLGKWPGIKNRSVPAKGACWPRFRRSKQLSAQDSRSD